MAWRIKWKRVRDEIQITVGAEVLEVPALQETVETAGFDSSEIEDLDTSIAESHLRTRLWRVLLLAVTSIVTAAISSTVTALIMTKTRDSLPPPTAR